MYVTDEQVNNNSLDMIFFIFLNNLIKQIIKLLKK